MVYFFTKFSSEQQIPYQNRSETWFNVHLPFFYTPLHPTNRTATYKKETLWLLMNHYCWNEHLATIGGRY